MEKPEPIEEEASGQSITAEVPPAPSRPGPRFQRFLRLTLFTLAGALVLFLAGALTVWLVFTRPAQAGLRQATAELAEEVESLTAFETRNQELEQEITTARLQIAILNTLAEVMTARIELAGKNTAGVRLALNNVSKFLVSLEGQVQADEKEAVKAMQGRLNLVVGEFETNAFAAESDLDVLTENLKQLRESNLTRE